MSRLCEICGEPADHLHHPTGRDHLGRYLDRQLVLPVDHDHHEFLHDDWRHENLNELRQPRTIVEYVAIRLRRLAMNLGRWDQALGGNTFFGRLADAMQCWAEDLDAHVRLLDARFSAWREEEGFWPA